MRQGSSFSALAVAALIVACLSMAWPVTAAAAEGSLDIAVPSVFPLSGTAEYTDTSGHSGAISGQVEVIGAGTSRYLEVPGAPLCGSRLATFTDVDQGLYFRNNTLIAPIYSDTGPVAHLVLTTDSLEAGKDGYFGRITGVELDTVELSLLRQGSNFSASAAIFLKDLKPGMAFRISLEDDPGLLRAVETQYAEQGLSGEVPLAFKIEGLTPGANESIGFMFVSIAADDSWADQRAANNITLYHWKDGLATPQVSRVLATARNRTVFQATVSEPGTYAITAPGRTSDYGLLTDTAGVQDLLVFGGLLAILLTALAFMVRRVIKAKK